MSPVGIADPDRQRPQGPQFAALRAFEAVGRMGGLRRAAQSLGVHHAVVSRHVRGLEAWLGVELIDRLQSGGRLTEAGQRYHQRVSMACLEISSATQDLLRADEDVRLAISCTHGLASQWMTHHLAAFRSLHPTFDIMVRPASSLMDFGARDADVAIRYAYGDRKPEEHTPGLRTVEIARPVVTAVASPNFLSQCAPISRVDDLLTLPLLHKRDDLQWRRWFAVQGIDCTRRLTGLRLGLNNITVEAARNGQGIALANRLLLRNDLATGRLVEIEVGERLPLGAYHFTCRESRWTSGAMRETRRWLRRTMQLSAA